MKASASTDAAFMRRALHLAARGRGQTSPNPMVGAVLARGKAIIGEGWHHAAGQPHAEIEALRDAHRRGNDARGATLYVTLEPCCTHGRTPPCTDAIIAAGIARVVTAATDPNPAHAGRGFKILTQAGIQAIHGLIGDEANALNEVFNYWITRRTPFVTLKAGMTLDGRIATASGESKWITGSEARAESMRLRQVHDAILVGVSTIIADNPSLTVRPLPGVKELKRSRPLKRIILDSHGRTPINATVCTDALAEETTIYVTRAAPSKRLAALRRRVNVVVAESDRKRVSLPFVLADLGKKEVTNVLVEGGGEIHGSFVDAGLVQRIVFFYAPTILGGVTAIRAVGGIGRPSLSEALRLHDVQWKQMGDDLMLRARVAPA